MIRGTTSRILLAVIFVALLATPFVLRRLWPQRERNGGAG